MSNLAGWLYRFFLGPFMDKAPGQVMIGSMTRWSVAVFSYVEARRLLALNTMLGPWEAATVFVILFALPINSALSRARPAEVLDLLTGALPGSRRTPDSTPQEEALP